MIFCTSYRCLHAFAYPKSYVRSHTNTSDIIKSMRNSLISSKKLNEQSLQSSGCLTEYKEVMRLNYESSHIELYFFYHQKISLRQDFPICLPCFYCFSSVGFVCVFVWSIYYIFSLAILLKKLLTIRRETSRSSSICIRKTNLRFRTHFTIISRRLYFSSLFSNSYSSTQNLKTIIHCISCIPKFLMDNI